MPTIFKQSKERKIHPVLLKTMRKIVEAVVTKQKFYSDFEVNDKTMMERSEGSGMFAWYVYQYGTHLMPLNDLGEVKSFQQDWLGSMKSIQGKKENESDRLYVLNVHTGDLRRIYGFREEPNLPEHLLRLVV